MIEPTQYQHRYTIKLFQQVGPVWINTFSYQKWAPEDKEFVFTAGPLRYQVERCAVKPQAFVETELTGEL